MDGLSQSAQALTAIAERYTAGNNALNALKTGKAFVPLTASVCHTPTHRTFFAPK